MRARSDKLHKQLNRIERECQPFVMCHPWRDGRWALVNEVKLHEDEAEDFASPAMAIVRMLGMTTSETSVEVLRHIYKVLDILYERDTCRSSAEIAKWTNELLVALPSTTLATVLTMLDKDGYIEHNTDIFDSRPTGVGARLLNECRLALR